ncbi:MAG: aquaporin [Dehalococcoidia bacterium]
MNTDKSIVKLFVELIGTFIHLFIVVLSVTSTDNVLAIALAHGLSIALVVSAFSSTSGAHFNPAVTISFWVNKRIKTNLAILYILSQLIGATLGVLIANLILPNSLIDLSPTLATPILASDINIFNGIVIELILTFILITVIYGTAIDTKGPSLGGMAIGLVITMNIIAAGPLTGGVMNPARAFGPAAISLIWTNHFIYWIGPILGSILGGIFFQNFILNKRDQN